MVIIGVILAVILGLFSYSDDEQTVTQEVANIIQKAKWQSTYKNTLDINSETAEHFISNLISTLIDKDLIPLQNESFITYMRRIVHDNVIENTIDKRFLTGLYITLYIGYTHLHITRNMLIEKIVNTNITAPTYNNIPIHTNIILYIQSLPKWNSFYQSVLNQNTFYDPSEKSKVLSAQEVHFHISEYNKSKVLSAE